ncbi:hypothetical protein HT102_10210 [Hoyosella sp. G463]|uniref:Uncharacterized protein n=1 Tax=Lolliginicoccus lacisalsi TaxID=2742202 RepID=A0A927JCQ0_9ACTN|nr:hypothetical protein [Lolliginicoccus lacisalsi]MBD8506861.1 hypothetical protein [Lolliginicoccus lacisalsi]
MVVAHQGTGGIGRGRMSLGVGVSRGAGAPVPTGPRTRAVPVVVWVVLVLAAVHWLAGWLPTLLIAVVLGATMLVRVSGADLARQRLQARRARRALVAAGKRREEDPSRARQA